MTTEIKTIEDINAALDGIADATSVIEDMLAHIVALKSKEDEAVKAWQKDVAKVIDDGHDLNLPNNVMAPLRASSQAMTENLLEVAK